MTRTRACSIRAAATSTSSIQRRPVKLRSHSQQPLDVGPQRKWQEGEVDDDEAAGVPAVTRREGQSVKEGTPRKVLRLTPQTGPPRMPMSWPAR